MKTKVFTILCSLFFVSAVGAESKIQAIFETDITPHLKANWVVVDNFPARETEAKEILKKAAQHARTILDRLDPLNPSSETALLFSKKEMGTFSVSPDLAKILYATQEIAKQMKEPLAKNIRVSVKGNQVQLKTEEALLNIEPVLKGYMADIMMTDLLTAGFTNGLLEVDGIFIAKGKDFNGSWKIKVSEPTTAYAHHAFSYKALDVAVATVNGNKSDIRSTTIFSKEGACKAEGLATAISVMDLENAKRFLSSAKIERAVLIDGKGNFYQFPEKS